MQTLKSAASWLSLFALACACWFFASDLFKNHDLAFAFNTPGVWGACLFSAACSLFQPPAWPKGAK